MHKFCEVPDWISCHTLTRWTTTQVRMNTNLTFESEARSDASLVESCRAGDREAFGGIVNRYQSPICALTYSACGDVARSEDLAQEIFISAWKNLGSLREPARLKAWLFGIARNLIHNTFRRRARNPVAGAVTLDEGVEPVSPGAAPDAHTISKEEQAILWQVLSGLPEVYREAMVMFYRQSESISQVAECLGITEDAVRQRLSRGRALLNQRVAQVIQNGLRRTAPRDTFAVVVIAALPALAAVTTAKGAVVGMASTKGASSQATGLLGFLKSIASFAGLVAIPATLGSYFGFRLGQDSGGSPQRRKSVAKFWRVFAVGVALLAILPLFLTLGLARFLDEGPRAVFLSVMTFWMGLAYPFVFGSLLYWAWLRRRKAASADAEDASPVSTASLPALVPGRRISGRLVFFVTLIAAALLVFCYLDMAHNVVRIDTEKACALIGDCPASELQACVTVAHYRSLWREYPDVFQTLSLVVKQSGKKTRYWAPVSKGALELLAQKGVACPTYVQGKDFEVLGTPGRFLPFLAAFVLGLGALFLFKRRRMALSQVAPAVDR